MARSEFDDDGDSFPDSMHDEVEEQRDPDPDAGDDRAHGNYGDPDDEATEDALQAERDDTDALASEGPGVFSAGQDDSDDSHYDEARELGFRLLWWEDTSFLAAHLAIKKLLDQVFNHQDELRDLQAVGLPEGLLPVSFTLNAESGPLVMAGLQLLGIYTPELRPTLKKILATFREPIPTEEEKEAFNEAYSRLTQLRQAQFDARLREAGFAPVEPDPDPDDESTYGRDTDGFDFPDASLN